MRITLEPKRAKPMPSSVIVCMEASEICVSTVVADMVQINTLIKVLELDETNRVLDLGCGNGMITEYISDTTGAHITGVDISDVAIQQAQERTKEKRHRINILCGAHSQIGIPGRLI